MQLQTTLDILRLLGDISPEARQLIIEQDAKLQELETKLALTARREDALRIAIGMDQYPVDDKMAEGLTHSITNKYRVAEHFCLTSQDVADIINHTRIVAK